MKNYGHTSLPATPSPDVLALGSLTDEEYWERERMRDRAGVAPFSRDREAEHDEPEPSFDE